MIDKRPAGAALALERSFGSGWYPPRDPRSAGDPIPAKNTYVAGTRISLDAIVCAFGRGESPETIRRNFELLTLEEVYGAPLTTSQNRTPLTPG